MDWTAVAQGVWGLAEPVVVTAGLELVDVQCRPEGGRTVVRLLIDRPVVKPDHFRRAVGQRVYVRTRTPVDGRRQFRGTLAEVVDDVVTVDVPEVGRVGLSLADLERANIEFDFTRPAHAPGHA